MDLTKVQTTAWIRLKVEIENGDGNVIRVDTIDKAFNSRMTEVFKGSDLNKIIDEMFAHMKTQIENSVLVKSKFMCFSEWIAIQKAVINPQNVEDE